MWKCKYLKVKFYSESKFNLYIVFVPIGPTSSYHAILNFVLLVSPQL